jgi:2,3,4,5-tetrahydropyridine-2-carboxylate N-succinyltransferase
LNSGEKMEELQFKILEISENRLVLPKNELKALFEEFVGLLNTGKIRSAEPTADGNWKVNIWIKKGILLLFKNGVMTDFTNDRNFQFFDKDTLPVRPFSLQDNVRIVPGGSSVRNGCYVASGVICMPPMYINIGSYVDEGTMIDSHALVGTCAQVGKRCHISAASQIGGVLEPAGARPVIIEDDVLIGGNCGVYEGALVRKRTVMASGVVITNSTKIYDLVNERVIAATPGNPLEIPEGAVLVNGTRAIQTPYAKANGLSIYSPMIIKYRDEKTDAKTALEDALR